MGIEGRFFSHRLMAKMNKKMNRLKRCRGAELMEFTLALLPLLMMIFLLVDVSWGLFVKGALNFAVHAAVRRGITITGQQAGSSDLTTMVKQEVQKNALGLLGKVSGDAGWSKIKVHYFKPPDPGTDADPVDVCNQPDGNKPLNIMQVTIEGYSLSALVPRLYGKNSSDNSATNISAIAADIIEPSRNPPNIGAAP
jgi:Flp pilus assembly protein TadG